MNVCIDFQFRLNKHISSHFNWSRCIYGWMLSIVFSCYKEGIYHRLSIISSRLMMRTLSKICLDNRFLSRLVLDLLLTALLFSSMTILITWYFNDPLRLLALYGFISGLYPSYIFTIRCRNCLFRINVSNYPNIFYISCIIPLWAHKHTHIEF